MEKFIANYQFKTRQRMYLRFKRALDLIFALILLILLSPLSLVIVILLKIESSGKVIFKQSRPGYHQHIFSILKFRSMLPEVIKDGRPLTDNERLTKLGKFIRRASIDELPQLINIIKGEMSFIGPRPFLINDLDTYNQEQLIRFEVLPGITSWTAIHGRNAQTIQEKYNHEIYYVKNISFGLDVKIFLKTIVLVLTQKDVEDHVNQPRIGAEIIDVNPKNGKKEKE